MATTPQASGTLSLIVMANTPQAIASFLFTIMAKTPQASFAPTGTCASTHPIALSLGPRTRYHPNCGPSRRKPGQGLALIGCCYMTDIAGQWPTHIGCCSMTDTTGTCGTL